MDNFHLYLVGLLLIGFMAFIVILSRPSSSATVTYNVSPQVQTRLDSAKRAVSTLCANRGGAVFYDVQDQNVLVYACHSNDKLHLYPY